MTTRARRILATLLTLGTMGCTTTADGLGSGAIPCSNRRDDWWRVHVSGPSTVTISVDTVSIGTAFDPAFDVYDVEVWSSNVNGIVLGAFVSGADDDFECTFPPPSFECPSETYEASVDFLLMVENLGNCRGTQGEYDLNVFGADAITYLGTEP